MVPFCRGILFIFCLFLFLQNDLIGQTEASDTTKETFTVVLPLVYYTPETRLGLGAAAVRNFYPGLTEGPRPSQLQLGGAYTLNKQILLYFSYQLFLRNNQTELFGELGYYDYIYFYYGIGNETEDRLEETYSVRFPRFRINALEQIFPNFRAGVSYKFDAYNIEEIADGGLLQQVQPTGYDGGIVSTVGAILRYDTRDNVNLPLKGWYATFTFEQNGTWLGSDFNFNRTLLDLIKYVPVGEKKTIALNAYTGLMGGDAPFQELLFLGGPKKGRGIIEGRFRDEALLMFQAAYRFPLFWRLRGTVFGSAGKVGGTYGQLWDNNSHFNYGAGLRYLLNKKEQVQVRFDVGLGGDELGFYLTVGEAF